MQSKLFVKLPQIKTESHIKRMKFFEPENKTTEILNRNSSKNIKRKEIVQSLNKLRLISLTPEINQEKIVSPNRSISPKITNKLSILKLKQKFNKKEWKRKKILLVRESFLENRENFNEDENAMINIPKNYHCMNIRHFIYDFPNQNTVSKSVESKKRSNFYNCYAEKSFIHYQKF